MIEANYLLYRKAHNILIEAYRNDENDAHLSMIMDLMEWAMEEHEEVHAAGMK